LFIHADTLTRIDASKLLEKAYKAGFRSNKDLVKLDAVVRPRAKEEMEKKVKSMAPKDKFKAKGNVDFKAGNYEGALAYYQKALDNCDKSDVKLKVSLYCNRAICYQQQSDFSRVIEECNNALELDPSNVKALLRRSSAFEGMEKYRSALADVRSVLLRHPRLDVANKAQHRLSSAVRRLKMAKKKY
jgi:stress-induced-phosphoprotein 1